MSVIVLICFLLIIFGFCVWCRCWCLCLLRWFGGCCGCVCCIWFLLVMLVCWVVFCNVVGVVVICLVSMVFILRSVRLIWFRLVGLWRILMSSWVLDWMLRLVIFVVCGFVFLSVLVCLFIVLLIWLLFFMKVIVSVRYLMVLSYGVFGWFLMVLISMFGLVFLNGGCWGFCWWLGWLVG